jgi:hypothetical protein
MSATAVSHPSVPALAGEFSEACQVFILCEDLVTYKQAAEVCERLLTQFHADFDFGFNCWKLNELADPACARSATKTARAADILLLALRDAKLSPVLKDWMKTLSSATHPTKQRVMALVTGGPPASPSQINTLTTQLQKVATALGRDFLTLDGVPIPALLPPFQAAVRTGLVADMPSCDHWGLNE